MSKKLCHGEPKDVAGKCNAHLHIADNFGDNHATMRCQLPAGHSGLHQEKYLLYGEHNVTVTWDVPCERYEEDEEEEVEG